MLTDPGCASFHGPQWAIAILTWPAPMSTCQRAPMLSLGVPMLTITSGADVVLGAPMLTIISGADVNLEFPFLFIKTLKNLIFQKKCKKRLNIPNI